MQRRYILAPFQSPQFVYAQGSLLTSELSLGHATVSDPLHPRKLDTTGFRANRCAFVHWPLKARHNKYNQKGSKSMKEHNKKPLKIVDGTRASHCVCVELCFEHHRPTRCRMPAMAAQINHDPHAHASLQMVARNARMTCPGRLLKRAISKCQRLVEGELKSIQVHSGKVTWMIVTTQQPNYQIFDPGSPAVQTPIAHGSGIALPVFRNKTAPDIGCISGAHKLNHSWKLVAGALHPKHVGHSSSMWAEGKVCRIEKSSVTVMCLYIRTRYAYDASVDLCTSKQ